MSQLSLPGRSLLGLVAVALVAAACSGGGGGETGSEGAADPIDSARDTGERTVQFMGAGRVRLYGTLTVPPAANGAGVGGALLVPTAGRGDRNGLIAPTGVPDGLGQDVAKSLADAGLVSYRYDRRGTAESKLDSDTRLSFEDLVADARAALDVLAQRKETAGRDLAVVGYDQGALVALRLAATDNRVKRLVLISPPGRSVVDLQAAELAALYGPESAEALRSTVAALLTTRTLPPIDAMRTELRPLLPPQEAPFLAELYGLDPAAEASRVKVPTLIVLPRDPAPYDGPRLGAALASAETFTAAAGPSLLIVGPPPSNDPSNPASPTHEHGAGVPVPTTKRDAEALSRISVFLTGASASRPSG